MNPRRCLMGAACGAVTAALLLFAQARADDQTTMRFPSSGGGVNSSLVCLLSGGSACTMTGQTVYSGVATDVTTGTNESLKLFANGTGDAHIAPGASGNTVYLNQASTAYVDGVVSGSVTSFVGRAILTILGPVTGSAAAVEVVRVGDNDGFLSVFGTGVVRPTLAFAGAGDLATQSACAAAGDVRKQAWYSDTGTSKISLCVCEQTAAGVFAWGSVTATGDCT